MRGRLGDRKLSWRMSGLAGLFTLALVILTARLFDIQILQHRQLSGLALRQHQKTVELHGKRGTIYDRRMRELALSIDRESIYLNPGEFSASTEAIGRLSRVLGLTEAVLLEKVKSTRQFVWLKRKASPEEVLALRSLRLKGVGSVTESQRVYPKRGLAGHVIGFVGTDEAGLEGIEHAYESTLTGEVVRVQLDRDARGRPISLHSESLRELPQGKDLLLTLDERIQFVAERELRAQVAHVGARGGVALVMDPYSGEILALANETVFDPNNFRDVSATVWRERGTTDTIEPGSTLKALIAAAALEERLVRPDDMFYGEQGSLQVAGVSIRDHEKFGWLTVREVLERSSNVGAIKVGQRLGKERLYEYMARFGLGNRAGIDFPGEAPGLLRPPQQWSEVSIASLSIGQELAVTPLQMATAFSALGNGGILVRPHLVKHVLKGGEIVQTVSPGQTRRVISEATARQVTSILQGVVSRGTGQAAAVEGYIVAGKTGTAQKFDPVLGKYSSQKSVASFIGYVPANRPRVTIFVSLDEPQSSMAWGGIAAAPLFRAIAQETMRFLDVPPQNSQTRVFEAPVARAKQPMPGVSGPTISTALLVENVRDLFRSSVDHMVTYVKGHFLSVDPNAARKPRKKAEKEAEKTAR
jgi:cell division protein FtsI (penicillin-binding protein 3)